jgi:signal transduction histidine kinase
LIRAGPDPFAADSCHHDGMGRLWARALIWPLAPAMMVGAAICDLASSEHSVQLAAADVPLVAAMVACWVVGLVVTLNAPDGRAGWAFVGLGTAVAWSSVCDEYVRLAYDDGRSLPAWHLVAVLSDTSFVWWFVFIARILQLTVPVDQRRRERMLSRLTYSLGAGFQVGALLRTARLDPPLHDLRSPLAAGPLAPIFALVAAACIYALGVVVVISVVQLVRAWRHSSGDGRRQLLWLAEGAVPMAPAVVGAFVASIANDTDVASILLGVAMVTLVVGAGLSILRYRLYDVEQVVIESAAYAVAAVAVVVAYAVVLLIVTRSTTVDAASPLATAVATLAGVAVARLALQWARRAVGRRVNPSLYDAVSTVRRLVRARGEDLDAAVAEVLGTGARFLYPAPEGHWVSQDGRPVTPSLSLVDVTRGGQVTAALEYDPTSVERSLAEAVAAEASIAVDNVSLRAELARQLEVVSQSRSRLETAHLEERRRIERDLHDGAQQRLLASALRLRSARLNGGAQLLESEADRCIDELQVTVRELRDLAAGLQPAALSAGGLLSAVADLSLRAPVPLQYDVPEARFPAGIEAAAWFVIAEAVTNAVKHASPCSVSVAVHATGRALEVEVLDDGTGGANPSGTGLRGLADRVAAIGGDLAVVNVVPQGTSVRAVLPCVS